MSTVDRREDTNLGIPWLRHNRILFFFSQSEDNRNPTRRFVNDYFPSDKVMESLDTNYWEWLEKSQRKDKDDFCSDTQIEIYQPKQKV